jgi:hypothetical protein
MTTKYKPSKTLKQFIDVGKKDTRVVGSVERFLLSRPQKTDRRQDVLHPSEMVKNLWCHRTSYYKLQGYEPSNPASKSNMQRELVFEEGHRIHDKWQTWFKDMDKIIGSWFCKHCDKTFWGLHSQAKEQCVGPFTYKEVSLVYEPLKISGHSDGWLVGFGDPLLLEIKSLGVGTIRWEAPELLVEHDGDFEKIWNSLSAPLYTHQRQAQLYMKLMELIGMENAPQEAIIIYESKVNQNVKEFIIPKSDFGITELLDSAQMIVDCIDKKTPPICNLKGLDGCKQCKEFEYVTN